MLASVIISSVAYAARKKITPWQYDVNLPFWLACFELNIYVRTLRVAPARLFMNKCNNHISVSSWIPWVLHANWNACKKQRILFEWEPSNIWDFSCTSRCLAFLQICFPCHHPSPAICRTTGSCSSPGPYSNMLWHVCRRLTTLLTNRDFHDEAYTIMWLQWLWRSDFSDSVSGT